MKRTMIVAFALALFLAWGTTAMAQFPNESPKASCGLDVATNADYSLQLVFPYFANTEGNYWSGFSLVNTQTGQIAPDTFCLAVTDQRGNLNYIKGSAIAATSLMESFGFDSDGMFATTTDALRDALGAATHDFLTGGGQGRNIALAVYTNAQAGQAGSAMKGFGIMGTANHAQGYLAINNVTSENPIFNAAVDENVLLGAARLYFDYAPGGEWGDGWASGFSVFNNRDVTQNVDVWAINEEGDILGGGAKRIIVAAGALTTFQFEDHFPTGKRARVFVKAVPAGTTGVLDRDGRLHGFAYFSNTTAAQGMIPVYGFETETDDMTFRYPAVEQD